VALERKATMGPKRDEPVLAPGSKEATQQEKRDEAVLGR
jgi:hypothetical protein